MTDKERTLARLDSLVSEYAALVRDDAKATFEGVPSATLIAFVTKCQAAIDSVTRPGDAYRRQAKTIIDQGPYPDVHAREVIGAVTALKSEIENGYLNSFSFLIQSEMFSDYLEMARHLVNEGYKDAAAVISGSSLEVHLRNLCEAHGIETSDSNGRPKKADTLNADLAREGIYEKGDQKNVTAWLDLRNLAAHGHYGSYGPDRVSLLIDNVANFIQ
jgi:hypothetical protein